MSTEMKIDPVRSAQLAAQITSVRNAITAAAAGHRVRLVAVSKLKPANDILALHTNPSIAQTHFGENYTQELTSKSAILPQEIAWHFIGGLQTGHCKTLAKIPNLHTVSSVDTVKKAETLSRVRSGIEGVSPINVHVQVNTSGEENKSGCQPGEETVTLARKVAELPGLIFRGLMTIGAIARSRKTTKETENEDFRVLREEGERVKAALGLEEIELSMGMSEDFEGAIAMGSSEVRVGSTIFGERPMKSEAKLVD